jgi:hypothetical protein
MLSQVVSSTLKILLLIRIKLTYIKFIWFKNWYSAITFDYTEMEG